MQFISAIFGVLTLYFFIGIFISKKFLFFIPSIKKRKWYVSLGFLVLCEILFAVTNPDFRNSVNDIDTTEKVITYHDSIYNVMKNDNYYIQRKLDIANNSLKYKDRFNNDSYSSSSLASIANRMRKYTECYNDSNFIKSDTLKKYNDLDSIYNANIKLCSQITDKSFYSILRKYYVSKISNELWEKDFEVELYGKEITFINGFFAANKNKQAFIDLYYNDLKALGFTKVNTKWIKHEPEYTYWNIK